MTPLVRIATGLGAVADLGRRRVPNRTTAAGAASGLACAAWGVWHGLGIAAGTLLFNPRTRAIGYAPAIGLGAWISLLGGGWR
jgi:Flp pilus assembly protein protease CpaA